MDFIETILFESADLRARRIAGDAPGDLCVVTFDSYTDDHSLRRPGFGEAFFRTRGIAAVHVNSRENRWYQHAELDEVLAAVRGAVEGYDRVVTYGSSMGGYAALAYGTACGAATGIAISPQFSIDPRVCGFDRRWSLDAELIAFRQDDVPPLPLQYIFYDPRDRLDRQHVALFAARSPTVAVALPYGGHPVGSFVNETVGLGRIFDEVLDETLDAPAFTAAVRAGRRRSGQYLFTLAARVPAWRPRQKVVLAKLAVATNAAEPAYRSFLGQALDEAGAHAEARESHLAALAMPGNSFYPALRFAHHLVETGDLAEAERIVRSLLADYPDRLWLGWTLDRIDLERRRRTVRGRFERAIGVERVLGLLRAQLRQAALRRERTRHDRARCPDASAPQDAPPNGGIDIRDAGSSPPG